MWRPWITSTICRLIHSCRHQLPRIAQLLICPSFFRENQISSWHSSKNEKHFVKASTLWLDFDGGQFTPEDFVKIFWSECPTSLRHSFLIFNSFNRTPEIPNKFRVVMFLQRPARTIKQYKAGFDYVERRLLKAGFTRQMTQLDPNSRSPVQSYYQPCTNRKFPDMAFFNEYGTGTDELRRYSLDLQAIEATTRQPIVILTHPTKRKFAMSRRAAKLKAQLFSMKEGRHRLQYLFAVELKKLGACEKRIEQELRDCLGQSDKITGKIDDTLRSLRKWRQWRGGRMHRCVVH